MPPTFVSPCLACRRRLRWNGQPLFTDCSCVNHGRGVTIVALAAGVSAAALALLWRAGRTPGTNRRRAGRRSGWA